MTQVLPGYHWGPDKPPRGYGIDRGAAISEKLLSFFIFNENGGNVNDLGTSGAGLVLPTQAAWVSSVAGMGVTIAGGNNSVGLAYTLTNTYLQIQPPLTLHWRGVLNAPVTIDQSPRLFGVDAHSSGSSAPFISYGLYRPSGTTTEIDVGYSINSSTLNSLAITGLTQGVALSLTFTISGVNVAAYVNGVKKFTATNAGTIFYGGNSDSTLRCMGHSTVQDIGAITTSAAIWNRALGDGEIADLAAEPYLPILPHPLRRFWAPVAPAVVTPPRPTVVRQAVNRAASW